MINKSNALNIESIFLESNAARQSVLRWLTSYHGGLIDTSIIKHVFHTDNRGLFTIVSITRFSVLLSKHNGILRGSLCLSDWNQESWHNLVNALSILLEHEHGGRPAHSFGWKSSWLEQTYVALRFLMCDRSWRLVRGWRSH